MRITITGRNIELTEGLKAAVEEKLSKLEKFFAPDTDVFVTLSVEKERQKIEVTIPIKGHVIRSEQSSNRAYQEIWYEANVSGGCMCADGTDRTRFLRIPQCRDRRGQCRIQEKRKYIWSDRAGVLVHRNRRASIGCPFFV